jgi:succinoglycan biosynthesis protein ExoA
MKAAPGVSIVVAARNEAPRIVDCLQSIWDAEPFAPSFEVLVVDGASEDGTADRVREFARTHPEVRVLDNPARFAPQGFNVGIRAARGDWILILGAHSRYDRSYFRRCLEAARRTGADNAGGVVVPVTDGDGLLARMARGLARSRFGFGASPFRREAPPQGPADTAAFGCFPRRTFERFGLYDERLVLNQDWELNTRIRRGGGTVWLDPSVRVHWHVRQRPGDLVRRSFETGRWVAYMWRLGGHTVAARHAMPAAFAAALLVPGVNLAALAAHQFAAMVAAAAEARDAGDARLLAGLPPLFLAVHAAYGAGTLAGLVDLLRGRSPVKGPGVPERLPPREGPAGGTP